MLQKLNDSKTKSMPVNFPKLNYSISAIKSSTMSNFNKALTQEAQVVRSTPQLKPVKKSNLTEAIRQERTLTRKTSREMLLDQDRRLTRSTSRELGGSNSNPGSNRDRKNREVDLISRQKMRKERILARTMSQGQELDEAMELEVNMEEHLPVLLGSLRELLKGYTKCSRQDDVFLSIFLRIREYDVNRAFMAIQGYFQNLEKNREVIDHVRPSDLTLVFNDNVVGVLKGRCSLGSKVGLVQIDAWDTGKHTLRQIEQVALFQIVTVLRDVTTQLNGISIIFDLNGLTFSHAKQLTPKELKRIVNCGQGGLPVKITGIHFINSPSIFWGIYYIVQGFLKEKLRNRIHFHGSLASLHQCFNVETLPKSLGGTLNGQEPFEMEFVNELMKANLNYEESFAL